MTDRPSDRAIAQAFREFAEHFPPALASSWVIARAYELDAADPAVSAEPTAEHWRQAISESFLNTIQPWALNEIEQRARELAQKERSNG